MSKFLVETHYTCTFKIVHELDELNEKSFVKELRSVLPAEVSANVSGESLSHLFMKIDANSDGTVSWDEFVSFLFLFFRL